MIAEYTSNIDTWTQRTLPLPALSGDYYIAFEATGQYGYGVCIDDIMINGTEKSGVNVTPWLFLLLGED
jgi:hypothetical protein